jgi:hypothetical protein
VSLRAGHQVPLGFVPWLVIALGLVVAAAWTWWPFLFCAPWLVPGLVACAHADTTGDPPSMADSARERLRIPS